MDIQALLHNYPSNLLIAAIVGGLLVWILSGWASRRAMRAQREQADTQLSELRRDLMGEIDTKNDDIAQLENRLTEADHLTQSLSQKANLLANEQQRYADLKDRYLSDVGRARNLLKTRGDASTELERRVDDASVRYQELHQRWDSERKRYAKLVTEKNQQIAELDSRVEGMQLADSQDQHTALHSYSNGQLETMLVDLRQQVSDKETELQKLQGQLSVTEMPAAADHDFHELREQLKQASTKIDSKDREIKRLRSQLLRDSVAPVLTTATHFAAVDDTPEDNTLRNELDAKEAEIAHLKLEVDRLTPATTKLRRLETQMQQALRGDTANDNALKPLELELEQLQSQLSRQTANTRLDLEKQASAFQRQLNAKTDTIGRLNRQLQAAVTKVS